jgi:hypothetical protein
MADSLHLALAAFRDTMLTAVARLEFAIRDTEQPVSSSSTPSADLTSFMTEVKDLVSYHTSIVGGHNSRIDTLEKKFQSLQEQLAAVLKATEETKELLKIPAPTPETTRNVLISTPALTAAVAAVAVQPPAMVLDDEDDSDESTVEKGQLPEEEEVEEQDVEMESEEDETGLDLRQIIIKGKQYFMDAESSVYVETDEGYEEIGKYNPTLDCIEGAEEEDIEEEVEEEVEENEEAVEVEEFIYKNKTYQRDNENNVYDDGEHIGTWNGKKIVPLA